MVDSAINSAGYKTKEEILPTLLKSGIENLATIDRKKISSGIVLDVLDLTDYYGEYPVRPALHVLFPTDNHPLITKDKDAKIKDKVGEKEGSYNGHLLGIYPNHIIWEDAPEYWARHMAERGKEIQINEVDGTNNEIYSIQGNLEYKLSTSLNWSGTLYIPSSVVKPEVIEKAVNYLLFAPNVLLKGAPAFRIIDEDIEPIIKAIQEEITKTATELSAKKQ